MAESANSMAIVVVAAVALTATCLLLWPEFAFQRELKQRRPLDDVQFYRTFYADTSVPDDIPRRVRPIYCDYFNLEMAQLRPWDRPPEITERDTSDLVRKIEAEFGITIHDKDAENIDGSFDSIVKYLAARL